MKTFSIRQALKHGWETFKGHKKTLIAATFILMVVGSFKNLDKHRGWREMGMSAIIIWIALYVAATIVQIGWMKLALKLEDKEPVTVKELFIHSKLFLKYFVVSLIFIVLSTIGFVLLIIPGFYVLVTYGFAPVIAVDEYVTAKEAFQKSARMTKGVKWKLLGFFAVLVILNVLGAVPFLLGLFISIPATTLAYIHVYRLLLNRSEGVETVAL